VRASIAALALNSYGGRTGDDGHVIEMARILIIDDEEHILAAMAEYFAALGYEVDCALDEPTARALLDARDYRIVITDLRLSRSDRFEGLDLIDHVQSRSPQTPCIVLTAFGYPENEQRARQRGATAFMQKPKPLREIAKVVETLVKRTTGNA
jgi:two-component system, NtrC family, response regulator PilR